VKICLVDETGAGDGALSVLAARWGLEHDEDNLMALVMTPEHLELRKRDEPKLGGILSILSAGRWRTGASSAAVAAKRWPKRWASKGLSAGRGRCDGGAGARCVCAGVGGLSRADAGA
jgi:hypothetical protein